MFRFFSTEPDSFYTSYDYNNRNLQVYEPTPKRGQFLAAVRSNCAIVTECLHQSSCFIYSHIHGNGTKKIKTRVIYKNQPLCDYFWENIVQSIRKSGYLFEPN